MKQKIAKRGKPGEGKREGVSLALRVGEKINRQRSLFRRTRRTRRTKKSLERILGRARVYRKKHE